MQLISVTANKASFRPVHFNASGLSFIVARQKDHGSSEKEKTYNGVGKSLLVRIIDFCLGSNISHYKDFCDKLKGWEFCLEFRINVQHFVSVRKIDDVKKIFLNNEELSIRKFNETIESLCFSIPNAIDYLSFRSLIHFFLRPSKDSYVNCMKPAKTGGEYQSLLYNAFLLGLDINLAKNKYSIRKEQEKLKNIEKIFKDDSHLHDFINNNKDVKLELDYINEQIKKIEKDLNNFIVAEDYHNIQTEADTIESKLFNINNEIILIQNNINHLEIALGASIVPEMKVSDLERVYNEANINFPRYVKKTLQEVEAFYIDLITARKKRLSEQKNGYIFSLNEKIKQKESLQNEFDKRIKYLGEHQALDVYLAINKKYSELLDERNKLSQFKNMQADFQAKELQSKIEVLELVKITRDYLAQIEDHTKHIRDYFYNLAKNFYPQSVSGITINVHDGENQLAFSIEPRIDSDASDGINNVKIFCYDLTILFEGQNHRINFIFHDSRLFDSIDERQLAVMFQILENFFVSSKKQYIATINQNQLNTLEKLLSPEQYENIINKNIVLTLTDDSDTEKLLGIKVDIGNK
jgi:uncharacterized protein YydD (DUF2326 family)